MGSIKEIFEYMIKTDSEFAQYVEECKSLSIEQLLQIYMENIKKDLSS